MASQSEYYSRYAKENRQHRTDLLRDRRKVRKTQAIEYLGGRCMRCDGEFHSSVFDFHHRDPSEKEYNPSKMTGGSFAKMKIELDKCDLLCANCHRLVHWEAQETDDVS